MRISGLKRASAILAVTVGTLSLVGFEANAAVQEADQTQPRQDAAPARAPEREQDRVRRHSNDDRGPLAGPNMDERAPAPGIPMGFAESGAARRYVDRRANPRIYRQILKDIDLTDQQQETIAHIFRRFEQDTRDYFSPFVDEMRRLNAMTGRNRSRMRAADDAGAPDRGPAGRDQLRPGDGAPAPENDRRARPSRPGDAATDRPGSDRPDQVPPGDLSDRRTFRDSDDPEIQRAVMRLREINAGRPSAEPYLLEIWQSLTPEQQKSFESKAREMREDAERRERERNGIMSDEAGTGAGTEMMVPPPGGPVSDRADMQAQRLKYFEELLRKDENQLTERERRILERLRQRDEDGQRMRRRPPPPPPSADDIEFVKPDQPARKRDGDG